MLLRSSVVLLFLTLLLPLEAEAQGARPDVPRSSAAEMLEMCAGRMPTPSTPSVGIFACRTYMGGFIDYYVLATRAGAEPPFCLLPETTAEDVQEAFEAYARQHSERLLEHRSLLLFEALNVAFPCAPAVPETAPSAPSNP